MDLYLSLDNPSCWFVPERYTRGSDETTIPWRNVSSLDTSHLRGAATHYEIIGATIRQEGQLHCWGTVNNWGIKEKGEIKKIFKSKVKIKFTELSQQ